MSVHRVDVGSQRTWCGRDLTDKVNRTLDAPTLCLLKGWRQIEITTSSRYDCKNCRRHERRNERLAAAAPAARTSSADDLARRFLLDVTRDGAVFIRERGKPRSLGLPVFSTDSREEAETLRVRHCRLGRDGSGVYRLNAFSGKVDDLDKVSALFRATYADWRKRPCARAGLAHLEVDVAGPRPTRRGAPS